MFTAPAGSAAPTDISRGRLSPVVAEVSSTTGSAAVPSSRSLSPAVTSRRSPGFTLPAGTPRVLPSGSSSATPPSCKASSSATACRARRRIARSSTRPASSSASSEVALSNQVYSPLRSVSLSDMAVAASTPMLTARSMFTRPARTASHAER